MARTMRSMILQLEQMSLQPIWPQMTGCRVMSTYLLGGPARCFGLPRRPEYPGQAQVSEIFASFQEQSSTNYQILPVWTPLPNAQAPEWEARDIGTTPKKWTGRLSRAKKAITKIKKRRQDREGHDARRSEGQKFPFSRTHQSMGSFQSHSLSFAPQRGCRGEAERKLTGKINEVCKRFR